MKGETDVKCFSSKIQNTVALELIIIAAVQILIFLDFDPLHEVFTSNTAELLNSALKLDT